eukprot:gb/GEZN01006224.1/.p1 GENE.gb/GEZN01006224.1/~~gb/GEZN01006224.1/.p1  ORF type:complete len:247 (+),score=54.77 gb/GEZN01006224.1/:68-808(+)
MEIMQEEEEAIVNTPEKTEEEKIEERKQAKLLRAKKKKEMVDWLLDSEVDSTNQVQGGRRKQQRLLYNVESLLEKPQTRRERNIQAEKVLSRQAAFPHFPDGSSWGGGLGPKPDASDAVLLRWLSDISLECIKTSSDPRLAATSRSMKQILITNMACIKKFFARRKTPPAKKPKPSLSVVRYTLESGVAYSKFFPFGDGSLVTRPHRGNLSVSLDFPCHFTFRERETSETYVPTTFPAFPDPPPCI